MATKRRALCIAILDSGRTDAQIADKAKIHRSRFSLIKNGRADPHAKERLALAKVLNATPESLGLVPETEVTA